jgi:hypothetical protein
MAWAKREAVTNLVILGEGEGDRKKVSGLLVGCPHDRMYPDKINYELVQRDGEVLVLSGSASLARQLGAADIGKFVKCEFQGWGRSANGKFKAIDVNIWEGEPTPEMMAWPRWADVNPTAQKPAPASAPAPAQQGGTAKPEDFDDFPGALPPEADDLPF